MFLAYVQEWKEISAAVLPSPSSEEAHRNAVRLRLELVPSSTELTETTMDSLNGKVKEHSLGTATTGRKRTKPVLQSVNAMRKGTTTAVAGTTTDSLQWELGLYLSSSIQIGEPSFTLKP